MQDSESDLRVIQYLWDKFGSRPFNITSLVPRDMVPELIGLLPSPSDASPERAVMSYLNEMTQRNGGVYEIPNGERLQISTQSRADWKPSDEGFRIDSVG